MPMSLDRHKHENQQQQQQLVEQTRGVRLILWQREWRGYSGVFDAVDR